MRVRNLYQLIMKKRAPNLLSLAFLLSYCGLVEQLPYKNGGSE